MGIDNIREHMEAKSHRSEEAQTEKMVLAKQVRARPTLGLERRNVSRPRQTCALSSVNREQEKYEGVLEVKETS